MMYIAFHYRLPGDPIDPKGEKPGSWKAFPDKLQANAWIGRRKQKTSTSPQGGRILAGDFSLSDRDGIALLYDRGVAELIPQSLAKAIAAYLRYKSLPV